MTYCYDCPDHGSRLKIADGEEPPASITCWVCGRPALNVGLAPTIGIVQITPDIPEHYNVTIDKVVRSRRHLRDLQKRHGYQDYEGMRGSGLSRVFGPGGELRRLQPSEILRR